MHANLATHTGDSASAIAFLRLRVRSASTMRPYASRLRYPWYAHTVQTTYITKYPANITIPPCSLPCSMLQDMDQHKKSRIIAIRAENKMFLQKIFRLSAFSVSGPASKPPRAATRSRYACTISTDHASPMYIECEALKQLKGGSRSPSGASSGKKTSTAPAAA